MTNAPDWKTATTPAAILAALGAHRLLPVAGLLAARGLLRDDLVPVADRLVASRAAVERRRTKIEDEVLSALAAAGVVVLVVKGALLARTVYPAPEARVRTDIDLLVAREGLEDACAVLRRIGFSPSFEVHGGPSMAQAQWIRRDDAPIHAVDLHWNLSNRPLLKARFAFQALHARSVEVPGIMRPVAGLCAEDALLHACTHYFGHHRGEFQPDQWLLDMDLLWHALDVDGPDRVAETALSVGIASLVAAGMRGAVERFETPVDPDWLAGLERASRREPVRRFTRAPRFPALETLRSAFDERGPVAKLAHLRRLGFPPAAHMRNKYPGQPRWALPWLYVRRMLEGFRK